MYNEVGIWIKSLSWAQVLPGIGSVCGYIAGLFSAYVTYRLAKAESIRRERLDAKKASDQRIALEIEERMQRRNVPRMQFDIDCKFYGPVGPNIIADIHLFAENKGQRLRNISGIKYRIYGLKKGNNLLTLRQASDKTDRVSMNDFQLTTETQWSYSFTVEPGIRQLFPLTTIIDVNLKYIIIKIDVYSTVENEALEGSNWYGEERFFPVMFEHDNEISAALETK